MRPLGELTTLVQYGISERATEENVGVPMLRMNNLQADGWDLSDLKYIQLGEEDLERYQLQPGDLLFNRTNSKELVGKCEVFHEPGAWVFASYLIRVRLSAEVLPEFVSTFLNAPGGRAQIDRVSRHVVGMANVNAVELRDLLIPLPKPAEQRKLMDAVEAARTNQQRKLAQAEDLLTSLDGWLLELVGITPPPASSRAAFAVRLGQIDGPLNPERYLTLSLERAVKGLRVSDVAEILDSKTSPSLAAPAAEWDWIRIDDLPNRPIEVGAVRTELGSNIEGSLFEVRENDVLLARLGPTILNAKFVLCPETKRQTVASGEFLVLRCRPGWNPLVVLAVFRTSLMRQLMYSKGRGGTPSRYRVNADDFAKLPFPQIAPDVQKRIAEEVIRRRDAARRLRAEAEEEWAAAKAWFEEQLLGRPATAERNS